MRVHAIRTGTVQVHERQRAGAGHGLRRFANTLLDAAWTDPLPIHAWVLEHAEGLIVVDTGETARAGGDGYFPRWHPYFRLAVREQVEPAQEIGPSMRALGLDPADVRWVVMTHLHTDHAGGLHHFPHAEIVVSATEHATASGLPGKVRGYLPHRWPAWFQPTLIDDWNEPDPDFGCAHFLTVRRDVRIVPTPGHTAGHVSVLVEEGQHDLLFAGDTSYTQANLLNGTVDGVASLGAGEEEAANTLAKIRTHAARRPTVYLPSHDPEAERRLVERATLDVSARGVLGAAA